VGRQGKEKKNGREGRGGEVRIKLSTQKHWLEEKGLALRGVVFGGTEKEGDWWKFRKRLKGP